MPCSVFEDDESSGLESKNFGGVLLVMFLRESEKEMNLKNRCWERTGRAPSRLNCDVPLEMSKNRTQTKFENFLRLLNGNCI